MEVTISGTIEGEGATDVMAPDDVILTITDDELVPSMPRNFEVDSRRPAGDTELDRASSVGKREGGAHQVRVGSHG